MPENKIDHVDIYYKMLKSRRLEERAGQLYAQKKISGCCHLYIGQEAVGVGAIHALREDDYIISSHRSHVHCFLKGTPARKILAELTGSSKGVCKGKGGSMHLFDAETNFLGGNGIVGGQLPIAAGAGYSIKLRNSGQVVVVFMGEGAVDTGAFHETLNVIRLWELPVILIIENNHFDRQNRKSSAPLDIFQRAYGYGLYGRFVDGSDVLAMYQVTLKAVNLARLKGRSTIIEAETYRLTRNFLEEKSNDRDDSLKEKFKEKDPVRKYRKYLIEKNLLTLELDKGLKEQVNSEIEEAVNYSLTSPLPENPELWDDVFA